MAVLSYTEQLESVQTAIVAIEARGQAYQIMADGSQRQLTRGDLKTLYEREKYLRGQVKRESRGRTGIGITTLVSR